MYERIYAYMIMPVDFGWELLPTVEEHVARLRRNSTYGIEMEEPRCMNVEAFMALVTWGRRAAEMAGWDGDVRDCMHVFVVPGEMEMEAALIWKQENNGDTFVVSPVPLPHLERLCCNGAFVDFRIAAGTNGEPPSVRVLSVPCGEREGALT